MFDARSVRTYRQIFVFWVPMLATWLMMSIEGPFLAAVIARLADPVYNLAAYGVAFSFALIIEAPIIMIMSASIALVHDRHSFYKLRWFTYMLNFLLTVTMLILLIPPLYDLLFIDLMDLPKTVAELTYTGLLVLLPWPGAIGYRRFYQGLLIRANLTRRVAYGTVIRLLSMTATAFLTFLFTDVDGVIVGAAALSAGVCFEALASRVMVHQHLKQLRATDAPVKMPGQEPLRYRGIAQFYYPLAMTSLIGLARQPLLIFFMGQSRYPLESLAVLPVIGSLVFLFRSFGLSFQEVSIALLGKEFKGYRRLRNFATWLGIASVAGLSLICFTPLHDAWYVGLSGLSPELSDFAWLPTALLAIAPGTSVLLAFQRGVLVTARNTMAITVGTTLEVVVIIVTLLIGIFGLDMIGAVAASAALLVGRFAANGYLAVPFSKALRRKS